MQNWKLFFIILGIIIFSDHFFSFKLGMSVKYIETGDLASMLRNKDKSFAVLDVRGDDFKEGHIPSAIQISSEKWDDDSVLDEIISKHSDKKMVIIHCMMSQVRGPKCANKLHRRITDTSLPSGPEMYAQR